jgi:FG-GAP-like repeat
MTFIPLMSAILAILAVVTPARSMERLPDGGIAKHAAGPVAKAWYHAPTDRYDHGVLGDSLEAGALAVQTRGGKTVTHELDQSLVFEDITPRLVDLDRDGQAEIITIVSSVKQGASLAVFVLDGDRLKLAARTEFIGKTHRWLNVAGIADYDGDGMAEIAIVKTPHLGGPLEIWDFEGPRLRLIGSLGGFSNHVIGSRNLDLSATLGSVDDGRSELLVPSADRTRLRHVGLAKGKLREINSFDLDGHVTGILPISGRNEITVQLDNGRTQTLSLN